jgi:hypothetical protein
VVSCAHAIGDLDRDFCWLHYRWTYSRALGWRHALLFGGAAQWCRCLCGTVARVAGVKMTEALIAGKAPQATHKQAKDLQAAILVALREA